MSGYLDNPGDEPRPLSPIEIQQARASVRIPAVLLIVTGAISLVAAVTSLIQLPQVPAQLDAAIAQIDADPQIPQDQKDFWRDFLTGAKEAAQHPAAPAGYVAGIIASFLVILGGVKLSTLSGTTLPIIGSLLAMTPCTVGGCCVLGLPAGIWALAAMRQPRVKAAIAAKPSTPLDPDAEYMR